MSDKPLACLILAGGMGTRMKSATPKVLHEACGRTLLEWSLAAAWQLGADRTVVVVPPGSERIAALVPDWASTAVQEVPRGTGDAVRSAQAALQGFDGDVLVLYADTPLVDAETLRGLVDQHRAGDAAAGVLTVERSDSLMLDFGRMLRGPDGELTGIVEARDASPEQGALTEVNSGIVVFRSELLWPALERLTAHNDQGELYLTDLIGILTGEGRRVIGHPHADAMVAQGINTRADLAEAAAELRRRINHHHMLAGVTITDPASTHIDAGVVIEPDVTIEPFTVLRGATRIQSGAVVGPHVVAVDAAIGADVQVGPFCYLRPGALLERGSKAGSYVEIKNTTVGAGAKVPHLSYIGDAEIGSGTNIGAGAITANYDGHEKHRTVIGENVRTGSQNVFVAPVTIGDGAWTAAGSAITNDVPPDALGVARAKQTNIENYARRRRPQS
jgi:bifunctional UDP-N-acetylglucosamine pyrophosphorylase/glucosamine-1-phosphate N-acetyltransferase